MEEEVAQELFKRFAKPGETLDDDWIEAMEQTIVEEGELVATQAWNSGGPGAGAGVSFVYKYRGLFFTSTDFGIGGPYNGFTEAVEDVGLFTRYRCNREHLGKVCDDDDEMNSKRFRLQ
jgi:hypothetical protein